MKIGQKIKEKRLEKNWSQRDLAQKMGYGNHSTIGRIENGSVDIPQSRIIQFAEVLGVSIAYLMDWEEVQKNNDTLSDIIVRLRRDAEFLSVVETLNNLDTERLKSIKSLLSPYSTTEK